MKRIAFILLALFLLTNASFAQQKRPLAIDDYFRFKNVGDLNISPDGKWVAYVVSSIDQAKDHRLHNIYVVSPTGGDPVQITSSGKDEHPRWSPDNKYLAFLSGRNKKDQVYLMNRLGGDALPLTDIPQGVYDFEWSPNGKKLLLVLTDPDPTEKEGNEEKAPPPYVITRLFFKFDGVGYLKELYRHIYVFDVETHSLKQITSGPYDDADPMQSDSDLPSPPHWSPDGKWILFASNRTKEPDSNTNIDLFVVSTDGGEPRKLTTNPGADEMPSWSPDGKSIVYVTSLEPQFLWFDQPKIAVIPAAGGEPHILTKSVDRNVWDPRFGADGRIYFFLEDRGTQRLVSMPAGGGSTSEATPEKLVSDYELGSNTTIVYRAMRSDLPGEIFASVKGKSQQLTHINQEVLNGLDFMRAERISFKSRDGTPLEGFVFKPPAFDAKKKYPAILWIHGGPNEQDTDEWYFRPQFLASQGYVVLNVNYRGSTGYGKDFQRSIFADWGKKEVDDLLSGVDFLISQGYVDPNRLGMGGHSYGAILTNYLLVKTDRFHAAITDAGESNYLMDYGVDQYVLDWEAEVGKPWEKPARYMELSPYFHLDQVKTPTLVVCGQEDWNVPLINSEQLYLSLRRLGVDTQLIVYPEQPHEFWRPSYIKDRMQRYVAWYDRYLKPH